MEKKYCKDCRWFFIEGKVDIWIELGKCRRHPPTETFWGTSEPKVEKDHFCGEFEKKSNPKVEK